MLRCYHQICILSINAEVLAVSFAEGWPSASLWSDEGGLVIGSHGMSDDNLMRFLGLLNRLWDGRPFERLRLTTKSALIIGRRFTTSLMMQPIVMSRLLTAGGGAARNMGFIARNLVAWPSSTIGSRPYKEPPTTMPAIEAFSDRLKAILDSPLSLDNGALNLPRVQPSPAAKAEWVSFFDSIERELRQGGEFGEVADIGAKIAENAARLAAQFHIFEGGDVPGEIGKADMECAIGAASWYLADARRAIRLIQKPEDLSDADLLRDWLIKRDTPTSLLRTILRIGPAPLRQSKRRDAAVQVLVDKGEAVLTAHPARITLCQNGGDAA
jgi:hypothetical protein